LSETPPHKTANPPKATWDEQIQQLYESWHRRVAAAEIGHRLMSDRMRNRYETLRRDMAKTLALPPAPAAIPTEGGPHGR